MYNKLPVKERMEWLKSYKSTYPNNSYHQAVEHYNNGLQEFGDGGTLPKNDATHYYPTSQLDYDQNLQRYNDSTDLRNYSNDLKNKFSQYNYDVPADKFAEIQNNAKPPQEQIDRLERYNKKPSESIHNEYYVQSHFNDGSISGIYNTGMYKKPTRKIYPYKEQSIPSVKETVQQPSNVVEIIGDKQQIVPVKPKEELRTTPQYGYQPHPAWSNQQGDTTYWIDNPDGTRDFPTPQKWKNDTIGKSNQVKKYKWGGNTDDAKPKYSISYDNQYNQHNDNTTQPLDKYGKAQEIQQAQKMAQEDYAKSAYEAFKEKQAFWENHKGYSQEEQRAIQKKIDNPLLYNPAGTIASMATRLRTMSPDEVANTYGDVGNSLGYSAGVMGDALTNELAGAAMGKIANKIAPVSNNLYKNYNDFSKTNIDTPQPIESVKETLPTVNIPGIAELSKGKNILKEEKIGSNIYDKVIYPKKETKLSKDLEPYLSKKILSESDQDKVFNSFLTPEAQAKKLKERTINYNEYGDVVNNGFNYKGAFQKYPKGKLTEEEIAKFKDTEYYKKWTSDHAEMKGKYGDSWTMKNPAEEALKNNNRTFVNPQLYKGRNWGPADYLAAGLVGGIYPAGAGVYGLAFSPPAIKSKVLAATGVVDPTDSGFLSRKDTTIDLSDKNMDYAKVNDSKDGKIILGGEFIEDKNNSVRKAKDWATANDTYGDKNLPSKDVKSFYGVENGKFKVGSHKDFDGETEIVPMRFGDKNISKAIMNGEEMRILDNEGNPIYQNTPNTGKFILYSPSTGKSEFNYINTGKSGVSKVNKFLKENKDAKYITLDNGRYEFYGINEDGLRHDNFEQYYQQDLKRDGKPGYNLIIK